MTLLDRFLPGETSSAQWVFVTRNPNYRNQDSLTPRRMLGLEEGEARALYRPQALRILYKFENSYGDLCINSILF